jgi:hypothetical protein
MGIILHFMVCSLSFSQIGKVIVGIRQGALRIHLVLAQGLALFAPPRLGLIWFWRHVAAVEGGDSIQLGLSVFVDFGQVFEIIDVAQIFDLLHVFLEALLLGLLDEHLDFILVFETFRVLLPLGGFAGLASVLATEILVFKHFNFELF